MTLQEFNCEAQRRGNYYDNSAHAAEHWAKTWGLTYHSLLWYYKRYTIGNLTWKGGKVRLRHGSYQRVECFIGKEQVSEYRFKKALESFVTPPLTDEEKRYIEAEQQRHFNSIKVRLEPICVSLKMASPPFQFHKGTIRTCGFIVFY